MYPQAPLVLPVAAVWKLAAVHWYVSTRSDAADGRAAGDSHLQLISTEQSPMPLKSITVKDMGESWQWYG